MFNYCENKWLVLAFLSFMKMAGNAFEEETLEQKPLPLKYLMQLVFITMKSL